MENVRTFIYLASGSHRVTLHDNQLRLSKVGLSHFILWILGNQGDYALTCTNGVHISPHGTPSDTPIAWNIYDENDGYMFKSADGILTIDGVTIFKIHKYSMKSRIGMVHWGGNYRMTNDDYLYEGAKKTMDMGITSFKIYLGTKSDKTYFTSFKHTNLHKIVQQANYRRIFEMGFRTIVIISHYKTASYWKRLSDEERNKEMARERKELTMMAKELGKYPDVEFIISNWEGDCIINVDRTPVMFSRMVQWINNRQDAIDNAKCPNVSHAIEVNFVKQSLYGHASVTTEVLPHTRTDYVSYSCYDAQNEQEFEACVRLIQSHAGCRPLYIGEFGTPVNVRTTQQSWDYLNGIVNVMERHSIGLGCYWQLYDNEFVEVEECPMDKTIAVNRGCSNKVCKGFGIINPGKKVTGIWGVINTVW